MNTYGGANGQSAPSAGLGSGIPSRPICVSGTGPASNEVIVESPSFTASLDTLAIASGVLTWPKR